MRMKIYKEIRLNIDTWETEYEDSYEYEGELELCGGGASGNLTLPSEPHLDSNSTTRNYTSMVEALWDKTMAYQPLTITAGGVTGGGVTSPFYNPNMSDTVQVYDPSTDLAAVQARLTTFLGIIDGLDPDGNWGTFSNVAVAQADKTGVFPADDISVDVATIISGAITNAGLALTSSTAAALTDASSAIGSALTSITSSLTHTTIDDYIDSFEEESRHEYLQGVARFTAGMSDINAVNSSAFIFGLGIMERERFSKISQARREIAITLLTNGIASFLSTYNANIAANSQMFAVLFSDHLRSFTMSHMQRTRSRDIMVLQGAREMAAMLSTNTEANYQGSHLQSEVSRVKMIAKGEQIFDQLKIDESDAKWSFELFQYGANVLASASGAAMIPGRMSKEQSILSGATAGLFVGAKAGSLAGSAIAPGPGTAIGAGIGGILGMVGGAFAGQ